MSVSKTLKVGKINHILETPISPSPTFKLNDIATSIYAHKQHLISILSDVKSVQKKDIRNMTSGVTAFLK